MSFDKVQCKAITKGSRKRCKRWAIVKGYCALHLRKEDRGKARK